MMKKFIAALALVSLVAGPAQAVAQGTITTGMTFVDGGGTAPVVEAKWEMDAPYTSYLGTDYDMVKAGAQFAAPGVWGQAMNYSVCAIVSDANGVDEDIAEVNARIYYPEIPMHTYTYNWATGAYTQTEDPDNPTGGCGAFIEKNTLKKITDETVAYNLFCNKIKNGNFNLPTKNAKYATLADMYNAICGEEGLLKKDQARVYCDNKYLIWEDPAGNYSVDVTAVDKGGKISEILNNTFTYLENQGFEADFSNVAYGEVLYNTHKIIPGDKQWEPSSSIKPTVRNTGNVRLTMGVAQDDMGLCKNAGLTHVSFDARLGSGSGYNNYNPFKYVTDQTTQPTYTWLTKSEVLDLSEVEEMDFSIKLLNRPYDGASTYMGNLWLSAKKAAFDACPQS